MYTNYMHVYRSLHIKCMTMSVFVCNVTVFFLYLKETLRFINCFARRMAIKKSICTQVIKVPCRGDRDRGFEDRHAACQMR